MALVGSFWEVQKLRAEETRVTESMYTDTRTHGHLISPDKSPHSPGKKSRKVAPSQGGRGIKGKSTMRVSKHEDQGGGGHRAGEKKTGEMSQHRRHRKALRAHEQRSLSAGFFVEALHRPPVPLETTGGSRTTTSVRDEMGVGQFQECAELVKTKAPFHT